MEALINWLIENKEWLFSGAGLMVIVGIVRIVRKLRQRTPSQTIRSGKSSTNIQAGRDAYFGTKSQDFDVKER